MTAILDLLTQLETLSGGCRIKIMLGESAYFVDEASKVPMWCTATPVGKPPISSRLLARRESHIRSGYDNCSECANDGVHLCRGTGVGCGSRDVWIQLKAIVDRHWNNMTTFVKIVISGSQAAWSNFPLMDPPKKTQLYCISLERQMIRWSNFQ